MYDLTIQILHGIRFIHSLNIIHCDIKPENILVIIYCDKFCVKLTDIGSAVHFGEIGKGGTKGWTHPDNLDKKCSVAFLHDFYSIALVINFICENLFQTPITNLLSLIPSLQPSAQILINIYNQIRDNSSSLRGQLLITFGGSITFNQYSAEYFLVILWLKPLPIHNFYMINNTIKEDILTSLTKQSPINSRIITQDIFSVDWDGYLRNDKESQFPLNTKTPLCKKVKNVITSSLFNTTFTPITPYIYQLLPQLNCPSFP